MKKILSQHLHDNCGALYIWLLVFIFIATTIFSGILMIAKLNININNINSEIETASDHVMADLKKQNYEILRDGTITRKDNNNNPTDTSYITSITKKDFGELLSAELNNNKNSPATIIYDSNSESITQTAGSDKAYKIRIDNITAVNGRLTIVFTVHVYVSIGQYFNFTDTNTYQKSVQLALKEY